MSTEPSSIGPAQLSVRVSKRLSGSFALRAEFFAPPGIAILFGPSGSGKTTLLNCIAGLIVPDRGEVRLGARALFDSARAIDLPVAKRSIGYLFQDLALFPHLSIARNLQYGIAHLAGDVREERTRQIAESFRIAHLMQRKPGEISGGERQRAALARSLVTDPALLLLDEPLAALDGPTKSLIIEDLRRWNAEHRIPIVYVTHSPQEAYALGERVIVLDSGEVLAQGTPQQVLRAPRHETVAQLADFENLLDATVIAISEAHGTMTCRLSGSSVELEVPLVRAEPGAPIRIALRAGDIMLASAKPVGLSARNQFQANIISLERRGATVVASVESGARLEVHLTPGAREQLHLEPGKQVWVVIKTYSCHLVSPNT
jgi:molybdate transport system ATP-binding protein